MILMLRTVSKGLGGSVKEIDIWHQDIREMHSGGCGFDGYRSTLGT